MLIVSMPFYDFLHQHSHFNDGKSVDSHQHQEFSSQKNDVIALHSCIACQISQVAQTFFTTSSNASLIVLVAKSFFFEQEVAELCRFILASQGRAPPVSIL